MIHPITKRMLIPGALFALSVLAFLFLRHQSANVVMAAYAVSTLLGLWFIGVVCVEYYRHFFKRK